MPTKVTAKTYLAAVKKGYDLEYQLADCQKDKLILEAMVKEQQAQLAEANEMRLSRDQPRVTCRWTIWDEVSGEVLVDDQPNFVASDLLTLLAQTIEGVDDPYLVVGSDTAVGEVITEVYRQQVSNVIRSGYLVRFRTQILAADCNGTHNKVCIYRNATGTAGTGTMMNCLVQPWTKTALMILTVEARFTVTSG